MFSFDTSVDREQEAAPIVFGDTMVIVTPYPNIVYALDLTKPSATVRWTFEPKPEASAQGDACCDVVHRGAPYADGRVVFNTLDNQTITLDAASGKALWRVKLDDINRGETMPMASGARRACAAGSPHSTLRQAAPRGAHTAPGPTTKC